MSLLDVLASLPQFRSLRKAQDFVAELNGRGWLISISQMPRDTDRLWVLSAPEAHVGAINEERNVPPVAEWPEIDP